MVCKSITRATTLAYYDSGRVDTVRSGCLLTIFSLHTQTLQLLQITLKEVFTIFTKLLKMPSLKASVEVPVMKDKRGRSTNAQRVVLDCQMKVEVVCLRVNILNRSKSLQDIILNWLKMHDNNKHSSIF
jgi:hypothetical protein